MILKIKYWDITEEETDVIVNSANPSLLWWGWVDWQIHMKAWESLYKECLKLRKGIYKKGLEEWWVVLTKWYNLKSKYIIHTHWPVCYNYKDDSWEKILKACYINCLEICEEMNFKSISFPLISNWIFCCPIEKTSIIALNTIKNYFYENELSCIKNINIIIYEDTTFNKKDEKSYKIYLENYKKIFNN